MKHKTKLLAGLMAAIMILTAVSLASCIPEDEPVGTDTEEATTEPLRIEPEENPYITVSVSPVTVAVTNNQPTLKQTLTATIKPATTANKEVDWTVAWADSTGTGDVSDYITVTPDSDGSTNATVTCYQPFTGDIVITVITRDGGFTARCVCNYVGKPTSLTIEPGTFVTLLGPSGCGKTTLLNIVGGLDHYTSGDLIINGISTKDYSDSDWDTYRNHSIGFVFQSYNLIPHQTVLANVELALTLSGVSKAERKADMAERDLDRSKMYEYILDNQEKIYEGSLRSFNKKGMFVTLDNSAEGFIKPFNYEFNEDLYKADANGETYKLGDRVKVKYKLANKATKEIQFEIIERL